MRPTTLFITFLICFSTTGFGQEIYSTVSQPSSELVRSCKNRVENKEIEFCDLHSDTISYTQFANCSKLNVHGHNDQLITSFVLSYYLPDGTTVVEYRAAVNNIPEVVKHQIIKAGIRKILIQEIIGQHGDENLTLGNHTFYLTDTK